MFEDKWKGLVHTGCQSKIADPSHNVTIQSRDSLPSGRERLVISRTFSLYREMIFGANRIVACLLDRKLKPRNLRFRGRSTALLSRFTFNFSFPFTKRITDSITRFPRTLAGHENVAVILHSVRISAHASWVLCPDRPAGYSPIVDLIARALRCSVFWQIPFTWRRR